MPTRPVTFQAALPPKGLKRRPSQEYEVDATCCLSMPTMAWRSLVPILRFRGVGRGGNRIRQSQRWTEGEAVRLVKAAWRSGYRCLACIIAIAGDTSFSPVDVRTLAAQTSIRSKQ